MGADQLRIGKDAVYGFKDDRLATFDTFTMLIADTADNNVKEFELLAQVMVRP